MGNCKSNLESHISSTWNACNTTSSFSDSVTSVLFFPDPALPCRYGEKCHRKNCEFSHTRTSLVEFLEYFQGARKTMEACVFTITCNEITDAIIAAYRRGVKVRIITDNDQSHSHGSDISRLRDCGIEVRTDNSPMHMHHKFCIIDGSILINGSFNWTRQAVVGNRENLVVSKGSTTDKFGVYFEELWQQYSNNCGPNSM